MFDVVAIGELLIDFTPAGKDADGTTLFAQHPGGAPANVLAAVSRLGGRTAFLGKVGEDGFGSFLKESLGRLNIDTRGLRRTKAAHTTLAFVHLNPRGDRSFSFYRKPGADILLEPSELDAGLLRQTRVLHFGSVSLTDEPSRTATWEAVRTAKRAGAVISYDPNYRAPLWDSAEQAVKQMWAGLHAADVVKLSKEELDLLTGKTDLEEGARLILRGGVSLVLVTLGAKGAYYCQQKHSGRIPAYDVKTIDTNGAGDAFMGAALAGLKGKSSAEIRHLSLGELEDLVRFANAAGSLVTGRHGAVSAMPGIREIRDCMKHVPLL